MESSLRLLTFIKRCKSILDFPRFLGSWDSRYTGPIPFLYLIRHFADDGGMMRRSRSPNRYYLSNHSQEGTGWCFGALYIMVMLSMATPSMADSERHFLRC